MNSILHKSWPYFPYLLFAAFLIFGSIPLTDEAWFTYPSLTFLREGRILDVRWCAPERGHAFTMEMTSLVYALWYKLEGIDIIWGRIPGAICGLLFLIILNKCFSIVKVPTQIRKVAIGVTGINYFFLISTSQIRPEGLTLFASGMSLYMYLSWQHNRKSFSKLMLAHVFIILAVFLHWQATFAGMGLLLGMFMLNRQDIKFKHAVWIVLLYVFVIIIVYVFYIYPLQDEFIARMYWVLAKCGPSGGLHPHAGGMIVASIRYLGTSQYLKLSAASVMFAVIGAGIYAFWNRETARKIAFIYGFSGYVSWIATTVGLDDFHACWLLPAFMMMVIGGYEKFRSKLGVKRILGCGLIIFSIVPSLMGAFFAVRTVYLNPRVNIYEYDLKLLDSEFNLKNSTVIGEREIMWYFEFDPAVTFPTEGTAEYFIGPVRKGLDSIDVCNNHYLLVKKGKRFALYRWDENNAASSRNSSISAKMPISSRRGW
jgi:hypothetical protein